MPCLLQGSPYLHSFSTRAHILAKEETIKSDCSNQKEKLLHGLLDELRIQAVLTHGRMEVAELLQDRGHGVGICVIDAGRALAESCWF